MLFTAPPSDPKKKLSKWGRIGRPDKKAKMEAEIFYAMGDVIGIVSDSAASGGCAGSAGGCSGGGGGGGKLVAIGSGFNC